jgi:predicted PurR-regulated permease PerM
MVDRTSQSFDAFKYKLLGGRTRAFAIEFLNPTDEKLQGYATSGGQFLKDQVVRFGGFAGSVLGSLLLGSAIMIISLYFFLLDGPAMLESFRGLSPLDDEHEVALADEFANVSRAVVVATLVSALAQGVLAGIGFYFTGFEAIFLLTVLSAVLAMVPFVGAAAVWIPCSLYLYFVDNNMTAAIGLGIYGVAVISMADNFIKPFVLHGTSNLHPLLALLSVLGGVTALGPIGILIGPMVVVFLQTLLKILQRELATMDGAPSESAET